MSGDRNRAGTDRDAPLAAFTYDDRDWHEYECVHDHRWWSAPTANRCPVCGTSTYKSLRVLYGTIAVLTIKDFAR